MFSLADTSSFSNALFNEARIGYVRTNTSTEAVTPFKWSDVGVAEGEMSHNNELPSLSIVGSASIASRFPRTITQNSFVFSDDLTFIRGAHTVHLGGSVTRLQDDVNLVGLGSFTRFLSWPDFLLGLSAASNGTDFSNSLLPSMTSALRIANTGWVQSTYRTTTEQQVIHFNFWHSLRAARPICGQTG